MKFLVKQFGCPQKDCEFLLQCNGRPMKKSLRNSNTKQIYIFRVQLCWMAFVGRVDDAVSSTPAASCTFSFVHSTVHPKPSSRLFCHSKDKRGVADVMVEFKKRKQI
ncbi:hypothetical protein CDAR_168991 [Caerostris darwini]|uniref:Uncharacterized protein n=1 Tax=Caerostris darwini TaxID=1538125 RepID=A0AAV4WPP8_9ARAC|nr:hypothetical protein CDAR_168991 [Caerostris darwini]